MRYLLLSLLILSACSSNYPQESRLSQAHRVCAETPTSPAIRDEFMRQCVIGELTNWGTPLGYDAPSSSIRTGNSMYNNPDAFGPMGVWGPTWQEFNGFYQQNSLPQMQPMPMPPIRNQWNTLPQRQH